MKKICEELRKYKIGHKSARKKRSISKTRVYAGELRLDTLKEDNADWSLNSVHQQKYNHQKNEDEDDFFNLDSSEESEEEEELGIFHSKPTEVNSTQTDPHCGRISFQLVNPWDARSGMHARPQRAKSMRRHHGS
ncbi:unnamed protein product [Acanthoscelides obtectus]|nr:unnamed protein product [Acanthoscelides obtectus]CAH2014455.1 unnamed protein product [Acanthoscelides obtectus]CAK1619893.1 hypothetical protein AOBTE_LOCUS65 [Acanthoscelides obtectus]CAK1619986.1 hypothetical protein AOBTE_LOCUS112 [Acanthoscelides obtectus]